MVAVGAIDHAGDGVQLHRVDDRADVDAFVQGVADAQAVHPAFQLVMEAVGDAFLHQKARSGAADLALVEPDRIDQPFDGGVEIGVVKDDVGGFAAQFQGQGLGLACGGLADALADGGGAGEGDFRRHRGGRPGPPRCRHRR